MNALKEWAIPLLALACLVSLFLGYFWRVYHEKKNWDKWADAIRHEFLLDVTNPNKQEVSYYKSWMFIRRADGSVVIRKK